ncbi:MAG: hypothetical protein P1V34_06020 [Alphaproteobacteria bacterium]|nr:hypothetical protein [Alphaproteobacteria bacterium]
MNDVMTHSLKNYQDAGCGNLLIGRLHNSGSNFHAIRTEYADREQHPGAYLLMLNTELDDVDPPYLFKPAYEFPMVTDMGKDWTFDIQVDEQLPILPVINRPPIVLKGGCFFLPLHNGEGFYNCATGRIEIGALTTAPDDDSYMVSRNLYSISIPNPQMPSKRTPIFHWPATKAQLPR